MARLKYIVLDTKSTTVITISNPMDSGSSTMKFILMVFYCTSVATHSFKTLAPESFIYWCDWLSISYGKV